ncbi:pseudouridine synthase [Planctomycetales bacterium]|nr:pseudouridine synthase [Planctomycetales bacterium]
MLPTTHQNQMSNELIIHETQTVAPNEAGWRLDSFLADRFPQYSRTLIRNIIMSGGVSLDAGTAFASRGKPSYRLKPGQRVDFTLQEIPHEIPLPEDIPLSVLYEDSDLVLINKPVNMVVHPSRGHWSGTLVSALAFRFAGQLSTVRGPLRAGVVHRLDRDTSGVILIAKNDIVHAQLAALFEQRQIQKEYFAVVIGNPHLDRDMIDAPIGLHPKIKERMCIAAPNDSEAKHAQTFYEVIKRYGRFSTVRCLPKTGRTHQIRVHLSHAGYPILCDKMYGGNKVITKEQLLGTLPVALTDEHPEGMVLLRRQALHAQRLTFVHPVTGKELSVTAPLPEDMQSVIDCLEKTPIN